MCGGGVRGGQAGEASECGGGSAEDAGDVEQVAGARAGAEQGAAAGNGADEDNVGEREWATRPGRRRRAGLGGQRRGRAGRRESV